MRLLISLLVYSIILGLISLSGAGCANIIPPSGGPRDSLPPQLISAVPGDSATNFRAERIVLSFDEYISLQDVPNNILFTPTFDINPEIIERGRTITIRFRDTLSANTTYILNFGNAIRDVNEGNILRNFTYSFSTGPALDSLQLRGRVLLAQTGAVDSTLIVMLHRSLDDSAVIKNRPTYISRVDAQGNFSFRNLPAGTFAIYALGDAGIARRYQRTNQLFAFADAPVIAGSNESITLFAYRETPTAGTSAPPGVPRVPAASDRRLTIANNLQANQQDLFKDLILNFNTPLRSFDSAKIVLATDSIYRREAFTSQLDSTRKRITFSTAWKEATTYHLVLDRDFAEDTMGRKLLKTDTISFKTKATSDYGKLTVRLRNVDAARRPVLQFVQNDQVVFAAPIAGGIITQALFPPGEYSLRILYDTNGNGVWDPGKFFGLKRQPELIEPIQRRITVRPNWDNEFDL